MCSLRTQSLHQRCQHLLLQVQAPTCTLHPSLLHPSLQVGLQQLQRGIEACVQGVLARTDALLGQVLLLPCCCHLALQLCHLPLSLLRPTRKSSAEFVSQPR
jgi:hypothetical protein